MKTKRLLILAVFLVMAARVFPYTAVDINGRLSVSGLQLVNQCGQPVYLRGVSGFSLGDNWCSGCCQNIDSFDFISNTMTADVFRLAIEAGSIAGINTQVSRAVSETKKRGMYCIIDWHVLAPGDPNASLGQALSFWTAVAQAYKDEPHLLFEICNEPNGVTWATIRQYEDQVITAIRQKDPDRVIIAGTPNWSRLGPEVVANPITWTANIMYTFHFYAGSHATSMLLPYADQLPIFVTEWGASLDSGDGPLNTSNAKAFVDIMSGGNPAGQKMSWAAWSFFNKPESSAQLNSCSDGTWDYSRLTAHGKFVMSEITRTAGAPNACLTPTNTATPDPAIPTPTPRAVHKLNLQVKAAADPCSAGQPQYSFKLINNDTEQVNLNDLSVRMWFYDGNNQGYNSIAVPVMPKAQNPDGLDMPTPVVTFSYPAAASLPCTAVPGRMCNYTVTASFANVYKILPGFSVSEFKTELYRGLWASPFDQLCDDFTRTTITSYHENSYFALYENGLLVDEWLSPSVPDPDTGKEPCAATQTNTGTPTESPAITFTPTYTNTTVSSATGTNTATYTATYTASATDTATAAASATSTATNTPSYTSTPSETQTSVQSPTNTRTGTPSNTVTQTPAVSFTATATYSETATATSSQTAAVTATSTAAMPDTATSTQTPVFTATNTATASHTTVPAASATFTASFTETALAGATATPTPYTAAVTSVTLFPNPCRDRILALIDFTDDTADLRVNVFTMSFRKIIEINKPVSKDAGGRVYLEIKTGSLAPGIYAAVFDIKSPNGKKRIVKTIVVLK